MAVNFRFEVKEDTGEYTDLFFRSSTDAILDGQDLYYRVGLDVTIPAPDTETFVQTVPITTDAKMPDSQFYVFLTSTGEQAEKDYATINQIECQANQLLVTRLGNMPEGDINVHLVFYERRGN